MSGRHRERGLLYQFDNSGPGKWHQLQRQPANETLPRRHRIEWMSITGDVDKSDMSFLPSKSNLAFFFMGNARYRAEVFETRIPPRPLGSNKNFRLISPKITRKVLYRFNPVPVWPNRRFLYLCTGCDFGNCYLAWWYDNLCVYKYTHFLKVAPTKSARLCWMISLRQACKKSIPSSYCRLSNGETFLLSREKPCFVVWGSRASPMKLIFIEQLSRRVLLAKSQQPRSNNQTASKRNSTISTFASPEGGCSYHIWRNN